MPKYTGYAHRVEYPPNSGVLYDRGQNIPNMKKSDIALMTSLGHTFEGVENEPDAPDDVPEPATNMSPNASSDADAVFDQDPRRSDDEPYDPNRPYDPAHPHHSDGDRPLGVDESRVSDQHTIVPEESNVDSRGRPHTPGTPLHESGGSGIGEDPRNAAEEPRADPPEPEPTAPAQPPSLPLTEPPPNRRPDPPQNLRPERVSGQEKKPK